MYVQTLLYTVYVAHRLLEGGGHERMEGDDEVVPRPEHRVSLEHVMEFGDGVPAGQEHQDGSGVLLPANDLHQLQYQLQLDLVGINVP